MSEILKICGIAIITLILTLVLKSFGSQISVFLPQICGIFIFICAISSLIPIITFIVDLSNKSTIPNDNVVTLLKCCGIGILSQIISDLCKENGQEMLRNAVEFSAKIEILLFCIPMIKLILSEITGILML